MRSHIVAVVVAIVTVSIPLTTYGDDGEVARRANIHKLLEVTGATKLGQTLSQAMVVQMAKIIKSTHPNIPDAVMDTMPGEVNAVIAAHLPDFVESVIPLYEKYYSDDDVKALLVFYSSDLGKRVIAATPPLVQESMAVGVSWGQSLGPEIAQRIRARFKKEGVEL